VQRAFRKQVQDDVDMLFYLWTGPISPCFGKDRMATFETYFVADKATHKETKNPYFKLIHEPAFCARILRELGVVETGYLVNGHVPVKLEQGETPIKSSKRAITIDGAFAAAYGDKGFSLVLDAHRMYLAQHHHFDGSEAVIEAGADIVPTVSDVEVYEQPRTVGTPGRRLDPRRIGARGAGQALDEPHPPADVIARGRRATCSAVRVVHRPSSASITRSPGCTGVVGLTALPVHERAAGEAANRCLLGAIVEADPQRSLVRSVRLAFSASNRIAACEASSMRQASRRAQRRLLRLGVWHRQVTRRSSRCRHQGEHPRRGIVDEPVAVRVTPSRLSAPGWIARSCRCSRRRHSRRRRGRVRSRPDRGTRARARRRRDARSKTRAGPRRFFWTSPVRWACARPRPA
jgi:hypothetical protein